MDGLGEAMVLAAAKAHGTGLVATHARHAAKRIPAVAPQVTNELLRTHDKSSP